MITFSSIRKAAKAPLSQEDEEGLELVRWLNVNQMNKPSVLIAPTRTPKLSAVEPELRNFAVVLTGANMVQEVVEQAQKAVANEPSRFLDVEIHLRSRTQWGYHLVGRGFGYEREDEFPIDEPTVEDLSIASETIPGAPNWKKVLQNVGEKLLGALNKDKHFTWDMAQGLLQAGGETHARVRFVVKPDLYSLALEAVLCPETDNYWMLSVPVYRRLLDQPSASGCLFEGGQRIQCLIVDATASGLIADLNLNLPRLGNVGRECDWVKNWLDAQKSRFNIGDVRLLRMQAGEPALAQQVKDALESQDWGIVHYAGHSHYNRDTETGYVFFPGPTDGSIERVDLQRFSGWLRRATFTYFSSCSSGAGPFVFGLAKQRVPNILGFRWEIDDQLAFEYTKEFYEHLFENRSIEQAFLKARQQMHDLHPDDKIWAAPILIKQLGDS